MIIANSSQDLFTCNLSEGNVSESVDRLTQFIQEVKKLNSKLTGKEKTVKYLREKYEMNKISDQFSQKSKS